MVFLSGPNFARFFKHTNQFFGKVQKHPDKSWSRRRTFLMTSHFYGRSRNCFKLALRYNIKALQTAVRIRQQRKKDAQELWDCRIEGVSNTLNYDSWHMREALARTGIYLDRHIISNLTLTEPRTMRSLVSIAAMKTSQAPGEGGLGITGAGSGPDIKIVGDL